MDIVRTTFCSTKSIKVMKVLLNRYYLESVLWFLFYLSLQVLYVCFCGIAEKTFITGRIIGLSWWKGCRLYTNVSLLNWKITLYLSKQHKPKLVCHKYDLYFLHANLLELSRSLDKEGFKDNAMIFFSKFSMKTCWDPH